MTVCIFHVVSSERSAEDCPDCIIDKIQKKNAYYDRHVKYLKQFLREEDWDSALSVCQNLIDHMESSCE